MIEICTVTVYVNLLSLNRVNIKLKHLNNLKYLNKCKHSNEFYANDIYCGKTWNQLGKKVYLLGVNCIQVIFPAVFLIL